MNDVTVEEINEIENILKTAKLVEISEVLITDGTIRGINERRSAFIFSPTKINPAFGNMAFRRTNVLLNRLNVIKSQDKWSASITTKGDDKDKMAETIKLTSKGVRLDYRCTNPSRLQGSPSKLADDPVYTFTISDDQIELLEKFKNAIDAEYIKMVVKDNNVSLHLVDEVGDSVNIELDDPAVCIEDQDEVINCTFTYHYKTVLNVLGKLTTGNFRIGIKGLLEIEVNDITFYLLPHIG